MKQTTQWTIHYPDGSKATISHLGAEQQIRDFVKQVEAKGEGS